MKIAIHLHTHLYTHMHVECIEISEHKLYRLELIKTWERDATIFRSWQILCSRCFPLIRNKWKSLWIILRAILIQYTHTTCNSVTSQLTQRMDNSNNAFADYSFSIKWTQSIHGNLFTMNQWMKFSCTIKTKRCFIVDRFVFSREVCARP